MKKTDFNALPDIPDTLIYQEMMIHPAFFSHHNPQKIAIIGDINCYLLTEALKHDSITEIWEISRYLSSQPPQTPKVHYYENIPTLPSQYFDVIIIANELQEEIISSCFAALDHEGVIVQLGGSPFQIASLRDIQIHLQLVGFYDIHILNFPQPAFTMGWRVALIAKKEGIFKRVREKAIFNKNFSTRYYNLDVHKAALVLPEFMREALII